MRMDEVTINIPITIDLDSVGKPKVSVDGKEAEGDELDQNPVMMNPQQQELELRKHELGKNSPAIEKMLDDEGQGDDEQDDQADNIEDVKTLAGLRR